MMTVSEVSRLTGVSIRALHYYDQIGLLPAAGHTDSGYRLYQAQARNVDEEGGSDLDANGGQGKEGERE